MKDEINKLLKEGPLNFNNLCNRLDIENVAVQDYLIKLGYYLEYDKETDETLVKKMEIIKTGIDTSSFLLSYQNYLLGSMTYNASNEFNQIRMYEDLNQLYICFLDSLEEFCYNNIDNLNNLKFSKSYIYSIDFKNTEVKKFDDDFFKNNPTAYEWIILAQKILKEDN